MASFDLESLLTNVPLYETTDIILNNLDKTSLTKNYLKKCVGLAAHHAMFTFDDCLYTQTDG